MTKFIRNMMFDDQLMTMVRDAAYRVYLNSKYPYTKYKFIKVTLNVDLYGDGTNCCFTSDEQRILLDNAVDIKEERYLERFVSAFRWSLDTIVYCDDSSEDDISIEDLNIHTYYVDSVDYYYMHGSDDSIIIEVYVDRYGDM